MNFILFMTLFLGAEELPQTRYLTVQDARETALVSFVLNSVSNKSKITKPVEVSGNLIRFDLRDYGVSAENYDKLPVDETINNKALQDVLQSKNAIMRAEWFIVKALDGKFYYNFLGVKDLESFRERHGYKDRVREQRAVVSVDNVARNSTQIRRFTTIYGYIWESRNDDAKKINYFDDLLSEEYSSIQTMASNPNGLISYFLADKKGKPQSMLSVDIAVDHNFNKEVKITHSCVACHVSGVAQFTDEIRKVLAKDMAIVSDSAEKLEYFKELFIGDLSLRVIDDQKQYARALEQTTGMKPEDFNKIFIEFIKRN